MVLQEELQESKDSYNDLERQIQQVNSLEKKLLDKEDCVSVYLFFNKSASSHACKQNYYQILNRNINQPNIFIFVTWQKPTNQGAVF